MTKEAKGGPLLLHEISEMDVRLQGKLLRALLERIIIRVGTRPVPNDIRSRRASAQKHFGEDLVFPPGPS